MVLDGCLPKRILSDIQPQWPHDNQWPNANIQSPVYTEREKVCDQADWPFCVQNGAETPHHSIAPK
jgi:hypothetical protein